MTFRPNRQVSDDIRRAAAQPLLVAAKALAEMISEQIDEGAQGARGHRPTAELIEVVLTPEGARVQTVPSSHASRTMHLIEFGTATRPALAPWQAAMDASGLRHQPRIS